MNVLKYATLYFVKGTVMFVADNKLDFFVKL